MATKPATAKILAESPDSRYHRQYDAITELMETGLMGKAQGQGFIAQARRVRDQALARQDAEDIMTGRQS
jgi:porphobilinogen deaminase